MKKFKILLFTIFMPIFFNTNLLNAENNEIQQLKMLLFDCSGSEKYKYNPFLEIAKSIGINFEYQPIESVLDNADNFDPKNYNGAFFIIGISLLKNLGKNLISNKILNLVNKFYSTPESTIGLILPTIGGQNNNKVPVLFPLFAQMNLIQPVKVFNGPTNQNNIFSVKLQLDPNTNLFLNAINSFLNVPLEARPLPYDTALKPPANFTFNVEPAFSAFKFPVLVLPQNKNFSEAIKTTWPYGIYWFDQERKNNVFVTSTTLTSFSGISENFQVCPENFQLRSQIHKALQQTLLEFKSILQEKEKNAELAEKIKNTNSPKLSDSVSTLGFTNWDTNKQSLKKVGWMELNIFEIPKKKENESEQKYKTELEIRKKQQPELIDSIFKSGLDALWLTFNPQMYYSPIAIRKHEEDMFLNSVGLFTKSIKEKAEELKVSAPKILVGYEIANNIYAPNLPKNYSVDLYGNEYPDLPGSLDENFWSNEIKNPLTTFLNIWQKEEIGNGLKISGVVLDLEMYMRKQSGAFLNTMGFEQSLLSKFKQESKQNSDNQDDANYLLNNKKFTSYFQFLQKEAEKIGADLRASLEKNIPDCFIACYAPNISVDWFYRNFYKGLCNKNKNIQLMTFNVDYGSHQKWLEQNGINATHSSVLMLSKLHGPQSFRWVNHILKHNTGLWLNRFSRFPQTFDKNAWYSIEQTPMNEANKEKFFNYLKSR
ncbi:MAG: hypothetical protein ABIA74_05515 [bacterium]